MLIDRYMAGWYGGRGATLFLTVPMYVSLVLWNKSNAAPVFTLSDSMAVYPAQHLSQN